MAHEETDCPHFPSDCCTSQVTVGKGTHAGPVLGEGEKQPNVDKHDTIYARIKPFFLALILSHGPIRLPGRENFCGHQQYKEAGENKPPSFLYFKILDQSDCRVERISFGNLIHLDYRKLKYGIFFFISTRPLELKAKFPRGNFKPPRRF
jgi:hypothetical protein